MDSTLSQSIIVTVRVSFSVLKLFSIYLNAIICLYIKYRSFAFFTAISSIFKKMNTIFQLAFSTVLLVQLGAAAQIPSFQKLANTGTTTNHRELSRQIFDNFVEKYEPATSSEGRISYFIF